MKKTFACLLIFMIIVLSFNFVYADSGHYKIELNTSKEELFLGDEFTVNIAVSNFQNVEDGINAVSGIFSYNSNAIELKSAVSASGWDSLLTNNDYSPTNSEREEWNLTENDKVVSFTTATGEYVKTNLNLVTLTFKVLDTANVGDKINVRLLYLDLANDNDYDEETLPTLNASVIKQEEPQQEEPKQEETQQEERKQEEPQQEEPKQEETKQENLNKKDSTVIEKKKLPQTGEEIGIIASIIVILAIMGMAFYKYKKLDF